jgi:hypothetical protein
MAPAEGARRRPAPAGPPAAAACCECRSGEDSGGGGGEHPRPATVQGWPASVRGRLVWGQALGLTDACSLRQRPLLLQARTLSLGTLTGD